MNITRDTVNIDCGKVFDHREDQTLLIVETPLGIVAIVEPKNLALRIKIEEFLNSLT